MLWPEQMNTGQQKEYTIDGIKDDSLNDGATRLI